MRLRHTRSARSVQAAGILLPTVLAVWLGACGPAAPERASLAPIPAPDLASLTEAGQERVRRQRAELDAVLARPDASATELARAYGETGRYYQAYELATAAEACYDNAEALSPETFDWPYLRAHLYRSTSEHDRAVRDFQRALEIDPEHLPAHVWLADLLVDLGRIDEAETVARAALALNEDAAPTLVALARVTAARGDHAETVDLLERARRIAPDATEIYYPLGLAYRGLGDEQRATSFLAQQGRVKARFGDPLLDGLQDLILSAGAALNRGALALGQGDLDRAESEFRAAIAFDPGEAKAYTNLAFVLAEKGDGAGARAALEQALAVEPTSAKANFNLASLLVRMGRSREARPYFEAALASDPSYVDAHFNHANNLVRLGEPAAAAEQYAEVLALDPANTAALLMRGALLLQLERWSEAIEVLELAHASHPTDGDIARSLARALATAPSAELADPARALELAEALVASEREVGNVETLAMALAAAGRFEEAAEQQQKALAAARGAGRSDLVSSLEVNLERFESGLPAATAWTENDPNMPGVQ